MNRRFTQALTTISLMIPESAPMRQPRKNPGRSFSISSNGTSVRHWQTAIRDMAVATHLEDAPPEELGKRAATA
jgi:hypothetical protein